MLLQAEADVSYGISGFFGLYDVLQAQHIYDNLQKFYQQILNNIFLLSKDFHMKITSYFLSAALLVSALVTFPGCTLIDWIKNKTCSSCNGPAVITVDGKTMLTCDQFSEKLNMIYQSRQGIQELIAQMPEDKQLEVLTQIADGLVIEHLIVDDVKERGLLDKATIEQARKQIEVDIAMRAFQEAMNREMQTMMGTIDDAQAQEFYEKNRSAMPIFQQPPFLLNAAQVKAAKDGKKVKGEYAAFEAVRDLVKQVMLQDKMPAIFNEKMLALKQKHQVVINNECFKQFVVSKGGEADNEQTVAAEAAAPEVVEEVMDVETPVARAA